VTGLIARVLWNRPVDAVTAQTHMALLVTIDGERWLVDVGFGGLTLTSVLRLQAGMEQLTPHEPVRLLESAGQWRLQAKVGGQWRALYRFTLQPCENIDYAVANHYVSTHPDSQFTSELIVARTATDQRLALRNHDFTVRHRDGRTEHYTLSSAREIRGVLERQFMLVLPGHVALDRRLAALPG
jgi:N-hydroxyarylamine O-acetyltransferase